MARKATDSLRRRTEKRFSYTSRASQSFKSLNEGQAVEFEVGSGAKGEQAINVTVVE